MEEGEEEEGEEEEEEGGTGTHKHSKVATDGKKLEQRQPNLAWSPWPAL